MHMCAFVKKRIRELISSRKASYASFFTRRGRTGSSLRAEGSTFTLGGKESGPQDGSEQEEKASSRRPTDEKAPWLAVSGTLEQKEAGGPEDSCCCVFDCIPEEAPLLSCAWGTTLALLVPPLSLRPSPSRPSSTPSSALAEGVGRFCKERIASRTRRRRRGTCSAQQRNKGRYHSNVKSRNVHLALEFLDSETPQTC